MPLEKTTLSAHSKARAQWNRMRPLLIITGGVLLVVCLHYLGNPKMGRPFGALSVASEDLSPVEREPERTAVKRAYLRSWNGAEGLGSYLQHFKQSIVLAEALDSEHFVSFAKSEHGYSTSEFWNGQLSGAVGRRPLPLAMDGNRLCRIGDYVPHETRAGLVHGLCGGRPSALSEMADVKARMAHCKSIVDTDQAELEEGLNGCIAGWVRARVGPARQFVLPPLSDPPTRPITVGVHVRWGDMAASLNRTGAFYGSMGITDIVRILRDIRARWGVVGGAGVQVKIAMQNSTNAGGGVLSQLRLDDTDAGAWTTLEVVDSGDPIADLYALSNNDILLVGGSSYALTAHLLAPPGGLTIAGHNSMHKFANTTGFGRHVVPLAQYSPDSLRLALRSDSTI
ncbi:hypothetical protein GGX14DRAFT_410180 [Mycena pura]|uniref:Uncharacterized protein n=1 Tax=Mycena pura TaxID=153505 RepID=A0AAD6YUS4_9AGAR|nr:hypothetical protein GGX14DRAFT_410180 [Mycena pura]